MKRKSDENNILSTTSHTGKKIEKNQLFIIPSDILLIIMGYLDIKSFQTVCIMLYKKVDIPLYTHASWPIPELNEDQRVLINGTAVVFDSCINVKGHSDWVYYILRYTIDAFKTHYDPPLGTSVSEVIKTMKTIQTSMDDVTLGRMLDFCSYSLCHYCNERRAFHEYFPYLDKKLSLCLDCHQKMENTMFTTQIGSKYLVGGRAWVSFTALWETFPMKRNSLLDIIKRMNIRQHTTTTSSKAKFYLLSDFIESQYFQSHEIQKNIHYYSSNYIEIDDSLS